MRTGMWRCVFFVVSFLASCIVLTCSKSKKFTFIELYICLYTCSEELWIALMLYKFMLWWSSIRHIAIQLYNYEPWCYICFIFVSCFLTLALKCEKLMRIFISRLIEEFKINLNEVFCLKQFIVPCNNDKSLQRRLFYV